MKYINLISNFAEFKQLKNIDNATLIGVLEDVFRHALQKQFESDENFDVIINPEKGDLEIWRNRVVVDDEEIENDNTEITLSEVKAIDATYEVGDTYTDPIDMTQFGRRAVLSLRQNLASRILDLEKAALFEKYSERVGEIISGEVYQVWKKEVLVRDDDDNDLVLPKTEQIPNDFYRKGDAIKAIVKSVEMNNNQPRIILSRTDNQFLERLFEQEVPEIFDGLITIKKIARIPGERAKVAVESYDDRIDPVGACVGMKGSRIYTIVKELRNENIDVVNYTSNISLMIQRSLNPAKISSITIDEERKTASVYLKPEEVSLAIGKGGLNIRLSKMLTGYDIDVYREIEEEDVALTEFADEIDGWIIDALKSAGCDTAKSVLELSVEDVANRADLEIEQAEQVMSILKAEFE
ncbi:MAG: transcription termination/antitermination protein NusA [Alistipes sp.]|nr:transcription termination/antitermination protein NusA [Alistipes sp.]MBR5585801.1 transcription termination/antitermination protein NusA [Alistipes sp.]MBR6544975.1 transcription termination/antitermination protein NusA [Alistipes sp.]